jgi:hemoglobin
MRTLFDRLGGRQAMTIVVHDFYDRLGRDPRVQHHFTAERLPSLREAQLAWLTNALGGSAGRPVADLEVAHRDLDITDDHVVAMLGHLDASLGEAGVDPDLQRQAMSIVSRLWYARRF